MKLAAGEKGRRLGYWKVIVDFGRGIICSGTSGMLMELAFAGTHGRGWIRQDVSIVNPSNFRGKWPCNWLHHIHYSVEHHPYFKICGCQNFRRKSNLPERFACHAKLCIVATLISLSVWNPHKELPITWGFLCFLAHIWPYHQRHSRIRTICSINGIPAKRKSPSASDYFN